MIKYICLIFLSALFSLDANAICIGGPSGWPNSPIEVPQTQTGEPTFASTYAGDLALLARNIINADHLNGNPFAIQAVKPGCTFVVETSDGALHNFTVTAWTFTECCIRTSVDISGFSGGGGFGGPPGGGSSGGTGGSGGGPSGGGGGTITCVYTNGVGNDDNHWSCPPTNSPDVGISP